MAALGGPEPHSKRSGVVHVVAKTDTEACCRPAGSRRCSAIRAGCAPTRSRRSTSAACCRTTRAARTTCAPSCTGLLDDPAESIELHPKWAPNITTTLGRLGGRTVGVIANNPMRLGGCLDSTSAEKAARFVRMCDAFGVPLVVMVDVPGYLPGVGQEHDGVVRRGAKLLHAFAEAVVPRVTL